MDEPYPAKSNLTAGARSIHAYPYGNMYIYGIYYIYII